MGPVGARLSDSPMRLRVWLTGGQAADRARLAIWARGEGWGTATVRRSGCLPGRDWTGLELEAGKAKSGFRGKHPSFDAMLAPYLSRRASRQLCSIRERSDTTDFFQRRVTTRVPDLPRQRLARRCW